MDFTTIGPWLLGVFAVPAVVAGIVAALALRGTRPEQRPGILHALADFARALLFRGGRAPAPVTEDRVDESGRP